MANDFKWSQSSRANGQKKKKNNKNVSSIDKAFEYLGRASHEATTWLSETREKMRRHDDYVKYLRTPEGQAARYQQRRRLNRDAIKEARKTLDRIQAENAEEEWDWKTSYLNPNVDPAMKFYQRLQTVGSRSKKTTDEGRQAVENFFSARYDQRRVGNRTTTPSIMELIRSTPKAVSEAWKPGQTVRKIRRQAKRYDSAVDNFKRAMKRSKMARYRNMPESQSDRPSRGFIAVPDVRGKK